MKMKQSVEIITPEIAKSILKNNTRNRGVSKRNLEHLVSEIKNKNWMLSHQGICIAEDGSLLDGQHRLLAVIKAGMPIKTLVTTGVDREVFKVVDTGRKRNVSDVLHIEGFKYSNELAAVCKKIHLWNDKKDMKSSVLSSLQVEDMISIADAQSQSIYDAISHVYSTKDRIYQKACAYFVVWLFRDNEILLDKFDQILTGISTDKYLINFKNKLIDNKVRGLRLRETVLLTETFHAIKCSLIDKNKRLADPTNVSNLYKTYDEIVSLTMSI